VTTPTPAVRRRSLALASIAAVALAACSGGGSASEQLPTGPKPSITVLLRVGDDAGSTVELLGTRTSQQALDQAAGAVAHVAFPQAQVGAPEPPATTDPGLTVASVPVQLSSGAMNFELQSGAMAAALDSAHPKAIGVWVCTDDRRSLLVDSTAPGSVTSDVVNGQCQVAGSTLEGDGVTWTARVSVGEVRPPSKLPWLIGVAIVAALVAGGVWLMRSRRAEEPEEFLPPPMPPAPPVH
jgi:hypothetical protein